MSEQLINTGKIRKGNIYILSMTYKNSQIIKIGWSMNCKARIKSYVSHGADIKRKHIFGKSVEKSLEESFHNVFKSSRGREWYEGKFEDWYATVDEFIKSNGIKFPKEKIVRPKAKPVSISMTEHDISILDRLSEIYGGRSKTIRQILMHEDRREFPNLY